MAQSPVENPTVDQQRISLCGRYFCTTDDEIIYISDGTHQIPVPINRPFILEHKGNVICSRANGINYIRVGDFKEFEIQPLFFLTDSSEFPTAFTTELVADIITPELQALWTDLHDLYDVRPAVTWRSSSPYLQFGFNPDGTHTHRSGVQIELPQGQYIITTTRKNSSPWSSEATYMYLMVDGVENCIDKDLLYEPSVSSYFISVPAEGTCHFRMISYATTGTSLVGLPFLKIERIVGIDPPVEE